LAIEAVSMMDLMAQQGYDVFPVDVRGYGGSTRPAEMDQPPAANKPIATSPEAAKDLGAAVDYVLKARGIPKLDLIGWSWEPRSRDPILRSTTTRSTGWFSTPHVAALARAGDPLGACRMVGKDSAKARRLMGVAEDKQAALIPPDVFDAWWDANLATDPVGSKMTPL
jgi:hypothetical protein